MKDIARATLKKRNLETPGWNSAAVSAYWSKEENKERQRNNRFKYFATQQMTNSKAESKFCALLDQLEISYERQIRFGRKLIDFVCKNKKIAIEYHGDFWHVNEDIFPDGPKYDNQRDNLRRDVEKNKVVFDAGYQLYRIWENDFKNDYENVKQKFYDFYKKYTDDQITLYPNSKFYLESW